MRTPRLYKDKYKLGMNKYRNFCSKSVFLKKGMKKNICAILHSLKAQ